MLREVTPTTEKGEATTSQDKTNKPLEQLAEAAARDLWELLADHSIALQERDIRLAQHMVDDVIEEIRNQVENEGELTRKLLDAAEKQFDAFRILAWESVARSPKEAR